MDALVAAVAVGGLLAVAVLVTLLVCAVLLGRAALTRGAAAAERARLTARSYAGGVSGEVARLRRSLDSSVSAVAAALSTARAADVPLGDVPGLLPQLRRAAEDCDTELRLLDGLRDDARAAALVPAARAHVAAVRSSALDLVDGLVRAAGERAGAVDALRATCAMEAEALRTGARVAARPAAT